MIEDPTNKAFFLAIAHIQYQSKHDSLTLCSAYKCGGSSYELVCLAAFESGVERHQAILLGTVVACPIRLQCSEESGGSRMPIHLSHSESHLGNISSRSLRFDCHAIPKAETGIKIGRSRLQLYTIISWDSKKTLTFRQIPVT